MTKTFEPQTVVKSTVKVGDKCDLLTFTIPVGPFYEIVAIANIPSDENQMHSTVYLKHRIHVKSSQPHNEERFEPQTVVKSTVKVGGKCDLLTFTILVGPFYEIVAIANIPSDENQMYSTVYLKHRIRVKSSQPHNEERDVRRDNDAPGMSDDGPEVDEG